MPFSKMVMFNFVTAQEATYYQIATVLISSASLGGGD
jgi:hypothetical protein